MKEPTALGADVPDPRSERSAYFQVWGSWLRSSRVLSAPRSYEELAPVHELDRTSAWHAVSVVTVNVTGTHIGIDQGESYYVVDKVGQPTMRPKPKGTPGPVTMLPDASVALGAGWRWDGSEAGYYLLTSLDEHALQIRHGYYAVVSQETGARTHPRETLAVSISDFYLPERQNFRLRWSRNHPGLGAGAIHDSGEVVVVMHDGHFFRYSVEGIRATSEPAHTIELKLSFKPYDISILESGYAVLSRGGSGTVVHYLDPNGKELWRVPIPFEATQPPVDGGKGRVYVAGKGLAAVQDGKLLYAHPGEQQWATAFEDGTVAVSLGPELRIVDRDGRIRQGLRTKNGERLTTPPAIASDGTIWVGSETSLYHAR